MDGDWKVSRQLPRESGGVMPRCVLDSAPGGPRQDRAPAVRSGALLDNTPFLGLLPFPDSLPGSLTGIS